MIHPFIPATLAAITKDRTTRQG